jgi:hypothetical protein
MTHIEELMVGDCVVRCGMTSARAFSHVKLHGIIARCAPRERRLQSRDGGISRIYYVVCMVVAHGGRGRARGDRRRFGRASWMRIRRWRRDMRDLAGIFNKRADGAIEGDDYTR